MITRKAAVVAIYGRVLNLVESCDAHAERVTEIAQRMPYSQDVRDLLKQLDELRTLVNIESRGAADTLIQCIPDADVHPLTGDVLDPGE